MRDCDCDTRVCAEGRGSVAVAFESAAPAGAALLPRLALQMEGLLERTRAYEERNGVKATHAGALRRGALKIAASWPAAPRNLPRKYLHAHVHATCSECCPEGALEKARARSHTTAHRAAFENSVKQAKHTQISNTNQQLIIRTSDKVLRKSR